MCIVLPPGFRIAVNIAGRDFDRPGMDDPNFPFPARGWVLGCTTIVTIAPRTYSRATRRCIRDPGARPICCRSFWGAHDRAGHAQRQGRADRALRGLSEVDPEATGWPSYHPSVLLKLCIYGRLARITLA